MRGKLMFLGGAAIGFVLGARAGRERYDELVATSRRLWDHPTVQEAAGVVQAQANRLYVEGKETVSERLSNSKLGDRLSHNESEQVGTQGRSKQAKQADPVAGTSGRQSGGAAAGR